ncbi:ATP-binding protein [Brachybacterium sp. UNK5269]|uniref:sensor histidine kinase n=1 Tax=Brachybacterium sp. UNK5269 TaxID=3408576 RepID=UPI003BAEC37D
MDLAASLTRRLAEVVTPRDGDAAKQLYFALLLLGFTAVIAISHLDVVLIGSYLAALAVVTAATVAAFAVPWTRLSPWWAAVIPLVDFVAIGLARDALRGSTTAISLLAIIPTLWLAARLRVSGTVLATVAATLVVTVPSLLRADHIDSLTIAHSALLPFTVLQIGLLASGALKLMEGQSRRMSAALAEQERLYEDMATSERLLENVIDSIDVGIVVVDRDGHDQIMNRAQHVIHDLATPPDDDDPDESRLLLRYPGTTTPIPPEDRPVRRAVQQETYRNYMVSIGPPGPTSRKFAASARQILDRHGHRNGAVVVFSDVTSYVEAIRTQERFVAAVSHELRTPLTSVIGYLDLAREEPDLPAGAAGYLEVANRNAEQLLTLVSDLLADQVLRSTDEGLRLRPRRVSEIADEVAESFAPQAAKAGITLIRETGETPAIPLDAHRMTQALDNLLSNALKYTPRGGIIRLHTCVAGGAVEVNVIDTGIGMSDAEQTNLFTDYYRTETARTSGIDGHGIGLALTRKLILAHGGQISVRSRPGQGSAFTIRLPLHAGDEVHPAS